MTDRETTAPPVVDGASHLGDRLAGADGLLLGLDFDGTLAPIAEDPDVPSLSESMRQSLEALAHRDEVRVVVVSGRELADLTERVGIPDVACAGNHGLEVSCDGERRVPEAVRQRQSAVRTVRQRVSQKLSDIPGSHLEDKGVTFTVHVRKTPPKCVDDVRAVLREIVAGQPEVKVTEGKQVFEVRPSVNHDKGTAMQRFLEETPDDWLTLYLGDDTTDEDAFEAIQPEGVGIYVGADTATAADYRVATQEDVLLFLRWLSDGTVAGD